MKVKNLFAMSLAALAMTACNNDENGPDGPNNGGNFAPGEATCAVFDIKVGSSNQTRATSGPETGAEAAANEEDYIENAAIYMFEWESEKGGRSDVSLYMDNLKNDGTGDAQKIPATPIMTSSGKKHIVIATNLTATAKTALDAAFGTKGKLAGYAEFYAAAAKITTTDNTVNPKSLFLSGTNDKTHITMLGESDATLEAGVTETEATDPTGKNHVKVFVDRALAKLDLKLEAVTGTTFPVVKDVNAISLGDKTAAKVGGISNVKYDVRNISKEQYYLTHKKGTDFIETPFSANTPAHWGIAGDPTNTTTADHRAAAYYPTIALDGTSTTGFTYGPLASAKSTTGAASDGFRAFMTENTSETAVVGNSSYTALKTTYKPINSHYINGFTNAATTNVVTLTPNDATTGTLGDEVTTIANGFSLFNQEYNIAFLSGADAAAAVKLSYLKTMAAYHTSRIEPSLKDIKATDILFIKAGKYETSTETELVTVAGYDGAKAITDSINAKVICTYLNAQAGQKPVLMVFVSETKNSEGKLNKITLSAAYFWNTTDDKKFVHNEGVNFGKLTFGVYNVVDNGLTSYYRVNIFDMDKGATHQMYYSVVRNYSYHVGITKINKIGFPTEVDMTIDPETPLNNNTFIQAEVSINKWVGKSMDTELGQ
ncbi:MAG: Mfa1 family fimbria major subunit [Tannerellaceae bacterium]